MDQNSRDAMSPDGKDPLASEIKDQWQEWKADRYDHEEDWRDIDRLMGLGLAGSFSSPDIARRERQDKPLTSTPAMALTNFASGLYGALINPATKWMGLVASDPDLRRWQPMREWQDAATLAVLDSFKPSRSTFYSSGVQLFKEIAGKGNGLQYDEELPGEGKILDQTLPLSENVWEIDGFGRVRRMLRMFRLRPAQAAEMFGIDNLPKAVRDRVERGGPQEKIVFYHRVGANPKQDVTKFGTPSKPFLSVYVSQQGSAVVKVKGYDEMPFYAPRFDLYPGQTYGLGLGHVALPSSRALDLMEAANLRAGQKAADPTLLAPNRQDMPLEGDVRPGEVLYGATDMQGRALVSPLRNFEGTGLTMEMAERKREEIKDSLLHTLMSLTGRTGMTATEVLEIRGDRLRLMAPYMGRIQEEYLAPKISRRFAVLWRAGRIPPPPEGLPEGAQLDVEYLSAAAMATQAQEGAVTSRLLEQLGALAQIDPRFGDRMSADDAAEVLAEAGGAPARVLRSREAADEIAAARAQQQQAAMAVEAAQAGAGIARDLAGAVPAGQA